MACSGLLVGYAAVRARGTLAGKVARGRCLRALHFPSIALGAIYIGMFSRLPGGPAAGAVRHIHDPGADHGGQNLPFTSRTGIAAILQIDKSLEENARVQGIGWFRRMAKIIIPCRQAGGDRRHAADLHHRHPRSCSLIILLLSPATWCSRSDLQLQRTRHDPALRAVTLFLVLMHRRAQRAGAPAHRRRRPGGAPAAQPDGNSMATTIRIAVTMRPYAPARRSESPWGSRRGHLPDRLGDRRLVRRSATAASRVRGAAAAAEGRRTWHSSTPRR